MSLPGSPSTVETYGMPTSPTIGFKNFQGIAKTDPQTDQDASEMNQELSDLSQMTRTCPRAIVKFTTGSSPSVVSHDAMWGNGSGVAPVASKAGTGHFQITWPSTITDPLGNTGVAVNLRWCSAGADGATLVFVNSGVTSANVVDVYTFNAAGAANDVSGTAITVYAY